MMALLLALTLQANTVPPGGTIVADVSDNTFVNAWVGLYPVGADDYHYLQWRYLNGTQAAPGSVISGATVQFPAPTLGTYEVRLYAPHRAATASVTIASHAPVPGGRIVFNGDSISALSYIPAPQNWTSIVGAALGFGEVVNLATPGKYAIGVLDETPQMGGTVCVVMIGANDMAAAVSQNIAAETARAAYLSTMRAVIANLKTTCTKVAIVSQALTLQPREVLRYGAWVDGLRMLSVELGASFLDLYRHMADLSGVSSTATVDSWYAVPGVDLYHLSPAGHALVAGFVLRSGTLTP